MAIIVRTLAKVKISRNMLEYLEGRWVGYERKFLKKHLGIVPIPGGIEATERMLIEREILKEPYYI